MKQKQSEAALESGDGSQTERVRGAFGGRQRWLTDSSSAVAVSPHTVSNSAHIMLPSPRAKAKVSAPAVSSFLLSMGYLTGKESQILDKEVNEVSSVRREHDVIYNLNRQKERNIKRLEADIQTLTATLSTLEGDSLQAQSTISCIENKAAGYESKLESEMADSGVYHHMIQRLTSETLVAKKLTFEKEKLLCALDIEGMSHRSLLLSARQEKTSAESSYQSIYEEWSQARQVTEKAAEDVGEAFQQLKLKHEILEQREVSRHLYVQEAAGEMRQKESIRTRREAMARIQLSARIQQDLAETDALLISLEADYKMILEAAGTSSVSKIISKYNQREETLRTLKEEHFVTDAKMRKLREKLAELKTTLNMQRSIAVNTRTVYLEMDSTAEKLKEIEKDAVRFSEKLDRANVLIDAFRACMLKCLQGLCSIQGFNEDCHEYNELSKAHESSTTDLLHVVEQKLSRVLDIVNCARAERELQRPEVGIATCGGQGSTLHVGLSDGISDKSNVAARGPDPSESEDHFVLRMSSANVSATNIRVRPKSVGQVCRYSTMSGSAYYGVDNESVSDQTCPSEVLADEKTGPAKSANEESIIDRHMRKKLARMIMTRGKTGKHSSLQR